MSDPLRHRPPEHTRRWVAESIGPGAHIASLRPTGSMTDYHGPAAVLLQDGRVLVAGGGGAGDVYSPTTGTWTATGPMVHPDAGGSALALLTNGQALSVGGERISSCGSKGCSTEPTATAELYTP